MQCDESKPQCTKCISYGVFCNYDTVFSDLQVSIESVDPSVTLVKELPVPKPIPWISENEQLLYRYRARTCATIGFGKRRLIFQHDVVSLAYSVSLPYASRTPPLLC